MTDIRKKLSSKKTKLAKERPKQEDHPANVNDCQEGSYYHLDIDLILPDPEQPEKNFDPGALAELANSIKQKRLYQPIVVRKDESGRIILVAGKRRLKAARMAGLEKIPAIFTQGNPLEISIIENLQRENLKTIEEAEAIGRMIDQHGYTEERLAFVIGKAQQTISEAMKLNRLPETIKDACRLDDKYPRQLLVEIAEQETPEAMMGLFNRAEQGHRERDEPIPRAGKQAEIPNRMPAHSTMERDASSCPILPEGDIAAIEERKKTQLLAELHNLLTIIDELIVESK